MSDAAGDRPPGDGQIITFYSFKGGTGRTMALANTAWILAANGNRVLIADWDLESPGLHRFFQPFLDKGAGDEPGIVDFIRRYKWAAADAVDAGLDKDVLEGTDEEAKKRVREQVDRLVNGYVLVQDYTIPVRWRFPGDGRLDYLSPGRQHNGDYETTVGGLDWDTFYDQLFGGAFFDALRLSMKEHYDYVLIDSRTGLSDVADICTIHLPDTVVDCFTLSTQGIEGGAMIAGAIEHHNERPIRILPVPMRIDEAELDKAEAGLVFAAQQFAGLPTGLADEERRAYWAAVGVPYRAFYAYEETLAVFGDRPGAPGSLLSAFERIVARLTGDIVTTLPPMEESLRLRTRLRFARREASGADEVILDFAPEDQLWAEWISAVLAGADIAVRYAEEADPLAPGSPTGPGRPVLAVVSDSYLDRMQRSAPRFEPSLAVAVTGGRLPHELDETPVVFLDGLPEEQAAERLLSRMDGGRKGTPRTPDVRYPGGNRRQVLALPTRNPHFTGRAEDLAGLRSELQSRGRAVVLPVTIQGEGGVGKTQLALEYVHRFRADYDLIWWMNCGQSQYVDASLTDLAEEMRSVFGASLPAVGSGPEIVRQVLELLRENPDGLRWLLVYDNADDIDVVRPLLPEGRGHVLITSRQEGWRSEGTSLAVDVFDRPESIRHLQMRAPSITEQDADRLAEVLGDLPLAVATAGAWLADTRLSVDQYLSELRRQAEAGQESGGQEYYPQPAAHTWDLSLDRLEAISPAGAWLLGLCSVMAPDISLDLIYTQAMAAVLRRLDPAVSEPLMLGRLVQQIDRLALIKLDNHERQISVHRVVQAAVQDRMRERIGELQGDVHRVLVAARPDGEVDDPATWGRYRQIWPHLTPSQAMLSEHEPVRQLLIDRARYLWLRGDLERALRRATEIEGAWLGKLTTESDPARAQTRRRQLFRLQFNKANILRSRSEFADSRELDEKVLRGQEELLGPEHPHTLMTRGSLAADYRAMGEYPEALELDRDTYRTWAREYGDEHSGTLAAANNLAISLRQTGDFQAALAQDKLTLERRAATVGRLFPLTLSSGMAVGRDLLEAGRYAEVVNEMRVVWAQCREALGDSDRSTLNARTLLGVGLRSAGHPEDAADHLEQARRGLTRGFGANNSDTLACRLSLALNHLALNHIEDARTAAQHVLAVYEERLGKKHPLSLICKLNIATALCLEKNYADALTMAQAAADGLAERLGHRDPYTLAARMVLGAVLACQGSLAEAEEVEKDVLELRRQTLRDQHPDTLRAQVNLLLTQQELGQRGARMKRREVIEELKILIGPEHPDVESAIREERLLCAIDPQPF